MDIAIRKQTETPDKPGWYYARPVGVRHQQPVPVEIDAQLKVWVEPKQALTSGARCDWRANFDWFGPVATCMEDRT